MFDFSIWYLEITCYDWHFWDFVFDLVENLSITRYPYGTPEVLWAANIKIKTSITYIVHTKYKTLLLFLLYFSGVSLSMLKGGMNICSATGQGPYIMRKVPLEENLQLKKHCANWSTMVWKYSQYSPPNNHFIYGDLENPQQSTTNVWQNHKSK